MRLRKMTAVAGIMLCITAMLGTQALAADSSSSKEQMTQVATNVATQEKNATNSEQTTQVAENKSDKTVVLSETVEISDYLLSGRVVQDIPQMASADTYNHAHDADIAEAMSNGYESINTKGWGITRDNWSSIVLNIYSAYPQCYATKSFAASIEDSEVTVLMFYYKWDYNSIQNRKKQIDSAVKEIKEKINVSGLTDLEIALAYHDYLASNVEYAYEHYLNDEITDDDYSMYGAFVNHSAVCNGYAQAFLYLMNDVGIDAGKAVSTNANHAWNVVKLNDNWYHVDVTFDDPVRNQLGRACHTYFMISTEDLLSKESERSDYVVYTKNGVNFSATVDNSYADGFWSDTDSATYVKNAIWYYFDNSTKSIKACDYPGASTVVISGIDTNNCKLLLKEDRLLYSTKSEIKSFNTSTRKVSTYYAPSLNGNSIYSFGMSNGKIAYTYGNNNTLAYVPDNADSGLKNVDGTWRYYTAGEVDTKYMGMAYGNGRWWYVKNGTIDFKYTGMAYGNGRWWYFSNGAIDSKYTGMAYGNGRWWYFENGSINFKYTGMAYGNGRWWYFSNGAIDFKYTGTAFYKRWWYFENGSINFKYTGMAYANNSWWYFTNGSINFKYTGIGQNKAGKWYFQNGQIAWKYSGNVTCDGKTYKVQNGKIVG